MAPVTFLRFDGFEEGEEWEHALLRLALPSSCSTHSLTSARTELWSSTSYGPGFRVRRDVCRADLMQTVGGRVDTENQALTAVFRRPSVVFADHLSNSTLSCDAR